MRRAALLLVVMLVAACTGGDEALRFSEDQLPAGVANEPYVVSIFISGNRTPVGGASVSSGELPDGLAVDVATGAQGALSAVQIHGTPTTPGSYTFTISVWCYGTNVSGQTGDKQYTLVVS